MLEENSLPIPLNVPTIGVGCVFKTTNRIPIRSISDIQCSFHWFPCWGWMCSSWRLASLAFLCFILFPSTFRCVWSHTVLYVLKYDSSINQLIHQFDTENKTHLTEEPSYNVKTQTLEWIRAFTFCEIAPNRVTADSRFRGSQAANFTLNGVSGVGGTRK